MESEVPFFLAPTGRAQSVMAGKELAFGRGEAKDDVLVLHGVERATQIVGRRPK
jgi:hypothetical protein